MLIIEKLTGKVLSKELAEAYSRLTERILNQDISYNQFWRLKESRVTENSYKIVYKLYEDFIADRSLEDVVAQIEALYDQKVFAVSMVDSKDELASQLMHMDLASSLPGINEYVEASLRVEELENLVGDLSFDSTDLVSVEEFRLLPQAIEYKQKMIYYHHFLRRFFQAKFVDIPALLARAQATGADVSIKLDPFRIRDSVYEDFSIEADHWYGAKFNLEKMNNKYYTGLTTHIRGLAGKRLLDSTYGISRTAFYIKNYKGGKKEIQIEELLPINPIVGGSDKYVLHRFAHLIWDPIQSSFKHFDCSVLAYTIGDHKVRTSYEWKPPDNTDVKGKRIKLFRLEGSLDYELILELLYAYFRYNEMISEYFTGVNFEDSDIYNVSIRR